MADETEVEIDQAMTEGEPVGILSPAEKARLEQIEQRALRVTEGTWDVWYHVHGASGCRCLSCDDPPTGYLLAHENAMDCDEVVAELNGSGRRNSFNREFTGCDMGPLIPKYEDAEFAAHAFNDIPFLVDLLKRMMR